MVKKILVPVANGIEELEAVTLIDVLRRAGTKVIVASVSEKLITASKNTRLQADVLITDCFDTTFDLIVLPGGLPGAEHLRNCVELTKMLKEQATSGRLYAAICASPAVVLKYHNLLDNKKATCYPSLLLELGESAVSDQSVVVDGNCITSQGPATALEFALKLVELLFSLEKATEVAAAMLVNKPNIAGEKDKV